MTTPTFLPPVSSENPTFKVAVKKAIIQAFRGTFTANYPDPILQSINVSMEYPAKVEDYPGIWVQFSFRDLETVGLGSHFYDTNGQKYQLWMYGGTVTLTIVAMTSKERDTIADKLIQMLAFHGLNSQAQSFQNTLEANQSINMSVNGDLIRAGGESTTVGAPWQPDVLVYTDVYSFDIMGQFASDFPKNATVVRLDKINLYTHLTTYGTTQPPVNDGNGTWM